MRNYKKPSGFTSVEDNPDAVIYDGACVYIAPPYLAEDESPRKYVVMETSKDYFLIADNKRMLDKGEGYIYSKWQIAYFKNL